MLKVMGILCSEKHFVKRIHEDNIKVDEIFQRIDMIFQYSIIWSLGSITDEAGQETFAHRFKQKISESFKV